MGISRGEFPDGFIEWLEPLIEGRAKLLGRLTPVERWVCHETVDHFMRTGRGPALADLRGGPHPAEAIDAALAHLDERDFLALEGERVLALYPFSARPCPHRVTVEGVPLYGM